MAHLSHAIASWPELKAVLADGRTASAWEWHSDEGRYVEVPDWSPSE